MLALLGELDISSERGGRKHRTEYVLTPECLTIDDFGFTGHQDFEVLPESGFNLPGDRPTRECVISTAEALTMDGQI